MDAAEHLRSGAPRRGSMLAIGGKAGGPHGGILPRSPPRGWVRPAAGRQGARLVGLTRQAPGPRLEENVASFSRPHQPWSAVPHLSHP